MIRAPIANASAPAIRRSRRLASARFGAAVDAELEDLPAELGEQRPGRVERHQRALVDDRHPVAQALGLVEVVGRDQDRQLVARRADPRSRRAARGGSAGRVRRSARRGTAPGAPSTVRARSPGAGARRRCSRPRAGRSGQSARGPGPARRSGAWRVAAVRPTAGRAARGSRVRSGRGRRPPPGRRRSRRFWPAAANGPRRDRPAGRVPAVGAIVVVSIPTVVDLPAPFGPSSPNTSPSATSKSIPLTASTPPG